MDIQVIRRSKVSNEKALEILEKFNNERRQQNDHKLYITGNNTNDDFFQIISNNLQHFQKYLSKSIYGDSDESTENQDDLGVEASNESMMEIEGTNNQHGTSKHSDKAPIPLDELITTPLKSNTYETDDGDISERNSDYGGAASFRKRSKNTQDSDQEEKESKSNSSSSDDEEEESDRKSKKNNKSNGKDKKRKADDSESSSSESSSSESESDSKSKKKSKKNKSKKSESSSSESSSSESESDSKSKKKQKKSNGKSKKSTSESEDSSSSSSESDSD